MAEPQPGPRSGTADRHHARRALAGSALAVAAALALVGCASTTTVAPTDEPSAAEEVAAEAADQKYPDIVSATLVPREDGTFDVEVTVSSPYDTPERYADGWRVLTPEGEVLGAHMLAHDHATEQPFTRTQRALTIPDDVAEVTVEGRDQQYGYGGGTVVVAVPRA